MNLIRVISRTIPTLVLLLSCWAARGQVNSGSTGADGAFNPTTNIVVDMSDHPTGIYHYTAASLSEVPFTKS